MSTADQWIIETSAPLKKKGEEPTLSASARLDPWIVYSKWQLLHGRAEPTSVEFTRHDGHPVAATQLRAIPLGEIVTRWRRALRGIAMVMTQGQFPGFDLGPEAYAPFVATGPHRGQSLTQQELERVAAVYQRARDGGMSVQLAVADAFHVARSTATKRIMAARRAGLLEGIGPRT